LETIIIVNPKAGNGKTKRLWPQIESALKETVGCFEVKFTSVRGEASILTRQALERGLLRIIAVGGDGLLNEVLNGFILNDVQIIEEACLSFIMTGTGCDFQRTLGISEDWKIAVENLKNVKSREIDVGKVTYTDSENNKKIRYFINIASFGLSGAVDYSIENSRYLRFLGSTLIFLLSTIKTVFTHPNQTIRYSIDGSKWNEIKTRLGVLANGSFFGGGMYVAPEAELDDGLLDLLILKEISIFKFLLNLPKIYRGTHLQIPEIFFQKIRKLNVSSQENVILDIDGESPGYLDASFEILPKILKLRI